MKKEMKPDTEQEPRDRGKKTHMKKKSKKKSVNISICSEIGNRGRIKDMAS